ncbi:hypothetical protein [Paenibacillus sp. M.A.Huq-84]|uniref:hypothetical protein n=1 Tax=Paenibacillus sp. M.A.Huq-84 TaxID=3459298 RepID=UPI0040409A6E
MTTIHQHPPVCEGNRRRAHDGGDGGSDSNSMPTLRARRAAPGRSDSGSAGAARPVVAAAGKRRLHNGLPIAHGILAVNSQFSKVITSRHSEKSAQFRKEPGRNTGIERKSNHLSFEVIPQF